MFQYNPLESYIETNGRGESLITVNNASVLSPKLRYNVGDEAITMTRPELLARLAKVGITEPLPSGWALPFLLLFGRSDSTVSYMGANIYPIDVEYGLYRDASLAASIESFCLELTESPSLEARPLVHVQLRATAELPDRAAAEERLRVALVEHLAASSRDFAEALRESPAAGDIRVVVHDHGTGPFAGRKDAIKNAYVVKREDG